MVTAIAVRTPGSDGESVSSLHDPLVVRPQPHAGCRASSAIFETAILPHLDAAYNLARWLMHDALDAEHLVEEACIGALRGPEAIRSGGERVWLLQIVRNAVYAELRTSTMGGAVTHRGGVEDDRAEFDAAVAALPIELRECLILRELESLSYHELALITGVPIDIVALRVDRSRDLMTARREQDGTVL